MLTTTPSTTARARRLRAVLPLATATTVATVLAVWCGVLAATLPATVTANHWSLTWVGLDAGEGASAALTAVLIRRRTRYAALTTTMGATFLLADAWFDVCTAPAGSAQLISVLQAAVLEVPLAAAALWFAVTTLRADARTSARPQL
ncbi:MAG TPA: hypothetical protein VH373_02485 [Jatrophihabitantaceae bacterium]